MKTNKKNNNNNHFLGVSHPKEYETIPNNSLGSLTQPPGINY